MSYKLITSTNEKMTRELVLKKIEIRIDNPNITFYLYMYDFIGLEYKIDQVADSKTIILKLKTNSNNNSRTYRGILKRLLVRFHVIGEMKCHCCTPKWAKARL